MESNRPTKFPTNPRLQVQIILAAVAILAGIGFWYFPWIVDDLAYRMPFREHFLYGRPVEIGRLWDQFISCCLYDNSRIASLAMVFVEFTPHIVQTALSVLALWCIFFFGLKILDKDTSVSAACIWTSCVILLAPWIDKMYVFDFQVAYLWGTAIAISYCYVLLNTQHAATLIMLGLILGCWQESFGFPVFISVIILWLLYPEYRNRRTALSEIAIFAGLVWLYLSPGGQQYRNLGHPMYSRIMLLLPFAIPSIIASCWLFLRFLSSGFYSAKSILLISSSLISALLMLYASYGPRIGWWSVTGGTLGILDLASDRKTYLSSFLLIKRLIAIFLLLFTVIHLTFVARYSYLQSKEYDYVLSCYLSAPDKTVFANMYLREHIPFICMQKPYFGIFSHERVANDITQFYAPGKPILKVVPNELASFRHENAERIDGSAHLYTFQGYMVGSALYTERTIADFTVWYADNKYRREMYLIPFIDADGITRAWYRPNALSLKDMIYPLPTKVDY